MTRTGSCLCGNIRYTLDGEPFLVGTCHCQTCRKESGSMFSAYAKWPIGAFALTGAVKTQGGRSFCPDCGARLFNLHDEDVENPPRLARRRADRPAAAAGRLDQTARTLDCAPAWRAAIR